MRCGVRSNGLVCTAMGGEDDGEGAVRLGGECRGTGARGAWGCSVWGIKEGGGEGGWTVCYPDCVVQAGEVVLLGEERNGYFAWRAILCDRWDGYPKEVIGRAEVRVFPAFEGDHFGGVKVFPFSYRPCRARFGGDECFSSTGRELFEGCFMTMIGLVLTYHYQVWLRKLLEGGDA